MTVQHRADSNDYRQIFLQDVPLIDVRAPIEFNAGAFPQAVNLPLMNDRERQAVGTCYKQHATNQNRASVRGRIGQGLGAYRRYQRPEENGD